MSLFVWITVKYQIQHKMGGVSVFLFVWTMFVFLDPHVTSCWPKKQSPVRDFKINRTYLYTQTYCVERGLYWLLHHQTAARSLLEQMKTEWTEIFPFSKVCFSELKLLECHETTWMKVCSQTNLVQKSVSNDSSEFIMSYFYKAEIFFDLKCPYLLCNSVLYWYSTSYFKTKESREFSLLLRSWNNLRFVFFCLKTDLNN